MKQRTHISNYDPVWLRVHAVTSRFGLARGTIYRLIHRNQLKSITLGRDSRSTRLIHYASLVDYLEGLWEQQSEGKE